MDFFNITVVFVKLLTSQGTFQSTHIHNEDNKMEIHSEAAVFHFRHDSIWLCGNVNKVNVPELSYFPRLESLKATLI